MKVRIKFSKHGPVKFIGHLDVMRYFQKAMRRASIDIKYSEGFSPHQIMSFASPLGVGLTSSGEYMDIEVNGLVDCQEMMERLNGVMVEGIQVLECRKLDDHAKNGMSLVAAADYTVSFREGKAPADTKTFFSGMETFYAQEHIVVVKKTKKGEKEVDIKPFIYELRAAEDRVFMKVSAGSQDNLKPELVMEAYDLWRGEKSPEFAFQTEREEVYGNVGDEVHKNLVPLGLIGEAVE